MYVERKGNQITVRQDFIGCWGLYLFREGDYWALSNSFLVLLDFVKSSHRITFNKEYADHTLSSGLCLNSLYETMVNEIRCLDRASVVRIDVGRRTISQSLIDYREFTVDPASEEGIQILDRWYEKWTGLIRGLKTQTNNIQMDLSGGYDTRMVFNLFLGSGINLNEISINSNTDQLHVHAEDYEIAGRMAEDYGFQLNRKGILDSESIPFTARDILNLSLNVKLGFHTQMYWTYGKLKRYRFYFGGSGGERLRDLSHSLAAWKTEDTFIESQRKSAFSFGQDIADSTEAVLLRSFDGIREKYRYFDREAEPEDIRSIFYMEIRTRAHFGKAAVENFLSGAIRLMPLLDSELCRLKQTADGCQDRNLIMILMHDRYQRHLMDFKVQGGRSFDRETVNYAHWVNEKYPYIPKKPETERREDAEYVIRTDAPAECANQRVSRDEILRLIKEASYSPAVRDLFESLYSSKIYFKLMQRWDNTKFFPESNAYTILAIAKVYQDCLASRNVFSNSCIADYVEEQAKKEQAQGLPVLSLRESSALRPFVTARIDIKNAGEEGNNIEILSCCPAAEIAAPDWYKKAGIGYMIHSEQGNLEMKFRCVGSGELQILLRGIFAKDSSGNHIPWWIRYTRFLVNGKPAFSGARAVWHDQPFRFQKKVKNGEEISVSVSWEPCNAGEDVRNFERENRSLKEKIAELEKARKVSVQE